MKLKMKNFNNKGVHQFLGERGGGGVIKKQYIGGIAEKGGLG